MPLSFGVVCYTVVPATPSCTVSGLGFMFVGTPEHLSKFSILSPRPLAQTATTGHPLGLEMHILAALRKTEASSGLESGLEDLEARDLECSLEGECGLQVSSTLCPSGAGSRQGRTRGRPSRAQCPGRGLAAQLGPCRLCTSHPPSLDPPLALPCWADYLTLPTREH